MPKHHGRPCGWREQKRVNEICTFHSLNTSKAASAEAQPPCATPCHPASALISREDHTQGPACRLPELSTWRAGTQGWGAPPKRTPSALKARGRGGCGRQVPQPRGQGESTEETSHVDRSPESGGGFTPMDKRCFANEMIYEHFLRGANCPTSPHHRLPLWPASGLKRRAATHPRRCSRRPPAPPGTERCTSPRTCSRPPAGCSHSP